MIAYHVRVYDLSFKQLFVTFTVIRHSVTVGMHEHICLNGGNVKCTNANDLRAHVS